MSTNKIKDCGILVIAYILLLMQTVMAQENIEGNLVSVKWLEKNINNENVILLDATPIQIYQKKHIPGAIGINSLIWFGVNEIPIDEMENIFQTLGVSKDKMIVVYDQGGSIMAARLFYTLYYYGFPKENLFILDGGLSKWEEEGLPITNEITEASNYGTFVIKEIREECRARLPETLIASGGMENNILIESLEPTWHYGEFRMFNRAGHIPNSTLLPNEDFYNPDKTFKSAEEIKRMMEYLGISKEKQIYTYCGGGIAASVPFFVLKFILKYPSVKLFIESELGWLKDERELPFWTYNAPYLMRESNWLQSWGGKKLRMYFDPQISIIDVRSSNEFKEGHIPFAVNIPYELFKENINEPDNLAEILSSAGVEAADEAVIVSGKGLTEESALAFILLKKLGQNKVSIFIDSIEKWKQNGFTLNKDTLNAEREKPIDEAKVTPNKYTITKQDDIVTDDINNTHGLYPKVYLASGERGTLNVANEKVVHLPYTSLINEDGTPKEAKDIWNIISKAGVPRYAELVCISDDSGEAAVNYFILKLMGFRDIKVLVF